MNTHTTALAGIVAAIADLCKEARLDEARRPGPCAVYPPSLMITILILQRLFGETSESGFLRYLNKHHAHLFPALPERSWFNRKAKRLRGAEMAVHRLLLQKLGVSDVRIRIVDATGVPVVKLHRARRCRGFAHRTEVNYGYCRAKDAYYYGEKLTLLTTLQGIPTPMFVLTPANVHDVRAFKEHLPAVAADLVGKRLVGDKGYCDGDLRETLRYDYRARLVVPDMRRRQPRATAYDRQLLKGRKIIETVVGQLQDHMGLDATRARSHSGLVARVSAILLSFTFGAYCNMVAGRDVLALKSILT